MLYLGLYYLGNLRKIFMTRNGFEDFKNIVDIWLLQYFMKLLGSELCILNTLICEVLMWFCHCSMILVIPLSLCQCLCNDPVCVTTHLCDDPGRLCDDLIMWPWVRSLVLKWYWVFHGSHWLICSLIVFWGSLVLHQFYHSFNVVHEVDFA